MSLPAETSLGSIRLVAADADQLAHFYERAVGLRVLERAGDVIRLGVEPDVTLLELVARPDAPPRPPRSTGLYHHAILVPDRVELARALKRVAEAGWRFTGASDHLVSEALYLDDPEGNGIELYRDRPREEWPYEDGILQMATIPLDLESLLAELPEDDSSNGMHAGTRLGHVHLQVSEIPPAEEFYEGGLGFDVMVRGYPGALFVSAGSYHHHIGMNTWTSAGAPPPPPGARGLDWYQVLLPGQDELRAEAERLEAAAVPLEQHEDGLLATDPSGNRTLLSAAQ